jgi:hypothetical protein
MDQPAATERQPAPEAHGLTGKYRVRVIRPALKEATRLCPQARHYFDLRAQALKLRYWPEHQVEYPNGNVLDLDWEWIRAMPGTGVGELRIDDPIANLENLRVIFYLGDQRVKAPLPMIWILSLLQQKRQDFTTHSIEIFRARRTLVIERFYKRREFE